MSTVGTKKRKYKCAPGPRVIPNHPPVLVMYDSDILINRRYRFSTEIAVSTDLVYEIIPAQLGALKAIGVGDGVCSGLFEYVHIRSVQIWVTIDDGSVAVAANMPKTDIEKVVVTPTMPGAFEVRIPKSGSRKLDWIKTDVSSSDPIFRLKLLPLVIPTFTAKIVIDLNMNVRLSSLLRSPSSSMFGYPLAVPGRHYHLALDNALGLYGSHHCDFQPLLPNIHGLQNADKDGNVQMPPICASHDAPLVGLTLPWLTSLGPLDIGMELDRLGKLEKPSRFSAYYNFTDYPNNPDRRIDEVLGRGGNELIVHDMIFEGYSSSSSSTSGSPYHTANGESDDDTLNAVD